MAPSTSQPTPDQCLKLTAALAATTGALNHSLLALASTQGNQAGPWLDGLEAQFIKATKNMDFKGVPMEAEASAVEAALANMRLVISNVRRQLASRARQGAPSRPRA